MTDKITPEELVEELKQPSLTKEQQIAVVEVLKGWSDDVRQGWGRITHGAYEDWAYKMVKQDRNLKHLQEVIDDLVNAIDEFTWFVDKECERLGVDND